MPKVKRPEYCTCKKCGEWKASTRHHLLPRRIYGRRNNSRVVLLCRECHSLLERRIPYKQIPRRHYFAIYLTFMLEGSHAVRLLQEGNADVVR